MMKLWIIILAGAMCVAACDRTENVNGDPEAEGNMDLPGKMYSGFKFNDTIYIDYQSCVHDFARLNRVCFDSVLSDSRCPENVVCVWEGEAVAQFTIDDYHNNPVQLELKLGTRDTIVQGLKISFVYLLPYPNTDKPHEMGDYKAGVVISRP